jgi:purine nucleosidase/pyrimidine-specific ribonucleoside hydrolase
MRFFCALFLAACAARAQTRIPVIFDTDIGDSVDDAVALALALQSPELDVRAVTTVIDDVESRARLAWKELGIYGRRDIALAMGASEPLLDPVHYGRAREFEVLTSGDTVPPAARRRASDLIVETLLASPQKITIVAEGPLTNIALAIKTEPRIKEKIERIVLMGGAYESRQAEYNIQRDRVAADIVFHSGVPITAVGLDVTLQCKLRPQDLDRLRIADDPSARFLMRLIDLARSDTHEEYPTLHDPLALAVVFRPGLIGTAAGQVDVSIGDPATYGVTRFTAAADLPPGAAPTTLVARTVNVQAFLDLLVERLASPGRRR